MSARRCYLVCYDICDPRRLRRIHGVMKAYGESWQYSVFYCVLREIDRVRLQTALEAEANLREDQILIIDLGHSDEAVRENVSTLGPSLPEPESGVVVI